MAINVSAVEFRNENFLEGLFAILAETGLDPKSLELEVTESVLMKNAELAASILQALRQKGVRVAIDDFGTGYSSLSYLRKFPLDALKIDQSFIRQIAESPDETTIVTAIINMGQSLRLRVIAEGVETVEDLAFLRRHDCDEAQGYYFSRPVPAEQFAALLKAEQSNCNHQAMTRMKKTKPVKRIFEAPIPNFDIENLQRTNLETLRLVAREGSTQAVEI
jgi:EAL domain-containing protein (putative c-di-GMP-specific phosphodiesterase class I)